MLLFIVGEKAGYRITTKFQYISCYCLSCSARWNISQCSISIHLMLLFIFEICSNKQWGVRDFNTSHVTVYRRMRRRVWRTTFISIHLMLLFIAVTRNNDGNMWGFQYISCYCLSCCHLYSSFPICYFNTSHVTVYLKRL